MAMQPLSPEDREFFQALSGERLGTPAEQALRADMLELGRLKHEIAEDDEALSPEQQVRRERVMAKLRQEGLLPTAKPKPAQESPRDAFAQLLGWLGIQISGSGMAVSPKAALALAVAVGGATYFATVPRQPALHGGDVLRSGAKLEIETADPAARCKAIEAALVAAKLQKDSQIVLSLDNEQECRVTVMNLDEVADRDAAVAIFGALGFQVESQARMEVTVRKAR